MDGRASRTAKPPSRPGGSIRAAALALALLVLGACQSSLGPRTNPVRGQSQEQVGSGHVAVLSVAPWRTYVDALQPAFPMTAEDALREAGATTFGVEQRIRDVLRLVAKVGLPQTEATETEEEKSGIALGEPPEGDAKDAGTYYRKSKEVKREKKPGEAPDFTDLESLETEKGEDANATPPSERGMDPFLRHTLATALYQEVQLLNRYVRDVARREGFAPYVVRLQVSLMPRTRTAPYDAYTTISFFPQTEALGTRTGVGPFPQALSAPPRPSSRHGDDTTARAAIPSRCATSVRAPILVPLLVTDNAEGLAAELSSDVARQYALALGGMLESFSLGGQIDRLRQDITATQALDYNSLLTVSRLTDNTVRVRLGARIHSTGSYFAVPQTRTVTLLAFVDEKQPTPRKLSLMARTEFVDSETGTVLRMRSREELARLTHSLFANTSALDFITDVPTRDALRAHALSSDYPSFLRLYAQSWSAASQPRFPHDSLEGHAQQAWTVLTSVAVGSQFSAQVVDLPPVTEAGQLHGCGPVPGYDDGQRTLRVVVPLAEDVGRGDYAATLHVYGPKASGEDEDEKKGKPKSVPDPLYVLPATAIEASPLAGVLQVDFPSLSRLMGRTGRVIDAALAGELVLNLRPLGQGTCRGHETSLDVLLVLYDEALERPGSSIVLDSRSELVATGTPKQVTFVLTVLRASHLGRPELDIAVGLQHLEEDKPARPAELVSVKTGQTSVSFEKGRFNVELPRNEDRVEIEITVKDLETEAQLRIEARALQDALPQVRQVRVTPGS